MRVQAHTSLTKFQQSRIVCKNVCPKLLTHRKCSPLNVSNFTEPQQQLYKYGTSTSKTWFNINRLMANPSKMAAMHRRHFVVISSTIFFPGTNMAECWDFNYSVLLHILHLIRSNSASPTSAYLQPKRCLQLTNFQTLGVRPGDTHKQHYTWHSLWTQSGSQQASNDTDSLGNNLPTLTMRNTQGTGLHLESMVSSVPSAPSQQLEPALIMWHKHADSLRHQLWYSFRHA